MCQQFHDIKLYFGTQKERNSRLDGHIMGFRP